MSKVNDLPNLRTDLKRKIDSGEYDVLVERIFKGVHRLFPRLPQGDITPFALLALTHLVICVLVSLIEGLEVFKTWLPMQISGSLIFYTGLLLYARLFRQLYRVLHEYVIAALARPEDVRNLARWLKLFSNVYGALLVAILLGALNTHYLQPIFATEHGLRGTGSLIIIFSSQIVVCLVLHHLIALMFFPLVLSRYQFNLYELDPGASPSIRQIANVIRDSTYILSLYATLFTFYIYFARIPIFPLALLYSIPLFGIFIARQIALSRIVARARSVTLGRLREQIELLDIKQHFDDPALCSQVNAIMNYYDRVKTVNSSVFDWRVTLTLINSLLLPGLAFVLTHYDGIKAFFGW
jgi:hypothetical protein